MGGLFCIGLEMSHTTLYRSAYTQHQALYSANVDANGNIKDAGDVDFADGADAKTLKRNNTIGVAGSAVMGAASVGLGALLILS